MATFQGHIEGLTGLSIGTNPTTTELDNFLQDAVKEVVNTIIAVNPIELSKFTASTEDTNDSGTAVIGKILSVVREHDSEDIVRRCSLIDPSMRYEASDSSSLSYRSKYNPGYYIKDGKIHTVPAAAGSNNSSYVTQVAYDTGLVYSDNYNAGVIENFPIDFEPLVALNAACKCLLNALAAKEDNLPSDLSVYVLDVISESLPSFTTPSELALPAPPSGADVDFSDVGTIETFVPPAFTAPTITSISDLNVTATVPTTPVLNPSAVDTSGLTNPTFTAPVMNAPDWSDTNTWISTEEDSEMLQARVQEISVKINEYSARLQEAGQVFNKENAILQKDLQIAQTNANTVEQGKLSKFSAEITKYQAEVNKEMQEWVNNFQKALQEWTQEYQGKLQEYSTNVQKESARVGASASNFQAQVNKAMQTFQSETGYDLGKYQAEVQSQIQKFQTSLASNKTDFDTSMAKYSSNIQTVASTNQNRLGRFNAELQNYAAKIQKNNTDYQWMQGRYMALKQEYSTGIAVLKPMAPPQQSASPQRQVRR